LSGFMIRPLLVKRFGWRAKLARARVNDGKG